ncbi:hypothetical protein LTR27_006505 [Elasticomyces elasticus]|nr:hypothetical protein LTR27_006505 [Elasticomyces elasticus]
MQRRLPDRDELIPFAVAPPGQHYRKSHAYCVRNWALGEKYQIPAFQDLIMVELLDSLEIEGLKIETAKEAFTTTPPGSAMWGLMAEELAQKLSYKNMKYEELDMFDGILASHVYWRRRWRVRFLTEV